MLRFLSNDCNPNEIASDALAFVGDAVYSLIVREKLCCESRSHASKLHESAVELVRCEAQAAAARKIFDLLTEKEKSVYLRGRNAHNSHVPKNSTVADYRAATGLEALVGYLYMSNNSERLSQLFSIMLDSQE